MTAARPAADRRPAAWNFRAMSTCRSPIVSDFELFIRLGINSKFAKVVSISGQTERGMT